jgi:hypothetical protein
MGVMISWRILVSLRGFFLKDYISVNKIRGKARSTLIVHDFSSNHDTMI